MDAYSMSVTSSAHRQTSKIYEDLKKARFYTTSGTRRKSSIMDKVLKLDTLDLSRRPHVGIVGAGFAGLRCADVLLKNGLRVTILEARNRLGGRIYQERLPNGHLIDVGANWIHGTTDNPIMDLVKETKTPVGVWDSMSYAFDEDGTLLPVEEGEKFSTLMWNIIGDAFEYSNTQGSEIGPERSLLDFFQEQVVKRIPETEEGYERQRHILLQMAELWGNFVGSPLSKQSLKFFWLEECIEGDGQVFEFDEVVVTCPLGWLKQNLAGFSPPLPDRLSKAIQNIGYGTLEKSLKTFFKEELRFFLSENVSHGLVVFG
ncbi:hypothetical protein N0V88_002517 [Collariella sp. IMI 366227]|nr:hypothetical protein N0V88_002517 [Collariella sp. IMI 366227]